MFAALHVETLGWPEPPAEEIERGAINLVEVLALERRPHGVVRLPEDELGQNEPQVQHVDGLRDARRRARGGRGGRCHQATLVAASTMAPPTMRSTSRSTSSGRMTRTGMGRARSPSECVETRVTTRSAGTVPTPSTFT